MIRASARNDPKADAIAHHVTKLRMYFISKIFEELGFDDEEAEVRTLLFLSFHPGEKTMFDWNRERRIESLAKLRFEFLTKQD